MSKNAKTGLICGIVLLVLVAAALIAWKVTRPETVAGNKTITLVIQQADGSTENTVLHTDAEYLLDAMKETEGLVDGYESEFGFTITSVNKLFADSEKGEWWVFTKGGEWVDTDVSSTPIYDGDTFEFNIYVY